MEKVLDLDNLSPELTRQLNDISKNSAGRFTDFIDELSTENNDDFWWATPLASRNTALCGAYLDFCKLKLAVHETRIGGYEKILVSAKPLQAALRKNISNSVTIVLKESKKEKIKRKLSAIYKFRNFALFWARILAVKHNSREFDFHLLNGNEVLINTYYIPAQFDSGSYKDRYFPGIEISDTPLCYVALMDFNTLKQGRELARNVSRLTNTIVLEKYIGLKELGSTAKYAFVHHWNQKRECRCDGLYIENIVKAHLSIGRFNVNSLYGIAYGNALIRLIGKHGINPKKFIFWYEGQPSSNYMINKIRKTHKEIYTVAYELTPMPEHYIELYPSKIQFLQNHCAHQYEIQGELWADALKRFCDDVEYMIAPSFRHNHVFEDSTYLFKDNQCLLAVLPIDAAVSSEFLRVVIKTLEKLHGKKCHKLFIKNHPANREKKIEDYLDFQPPLTTDIEYVEESIDKSVIGKSCVLLCDTTAVLEVALMGVPFMVYNPKGFLSKLCDPMDVLNIAKNNVFYDEDGLIDGLHNLDSKRLNMSNLKEIKNRLFCKVSKETVRALIG